MKRILPPEHISSNWQEEKIFVSAERFFANLIEGIEQAQHSIDMDYYIFDNDGLGKRVIRALQKACERGVRVRLIMDGVGSAEDADEIAETLSKAGAQVRIFHPHPFYPKLFRWSTTQGNALQKFVHFLLYINHRDHHKLCIVDDYLIWTGSMNITAKHLRKAHGGENWHDCAVKLVDPDVGTLAGCYQSLWTDAIPGNDLPLMRKVRSNVSMRLRRINNQLLIRRIRYARQRIWLCNAYFVPSAAILRAIQDARKNQIDVRLILPAKSDVAIFPLLSRSFYKKLLGWGVKIYEYEPDVLHAKLMLIDDFCLIGSTNLNHRSYYHDLEMDIVLSQPQSIAKLEHIIENDWSHSRIVDAKNIFSNYIVFIAARLLRLLRYWT